MASHDGGKRIVERSRQPTCPDSGSRGQTNRQFWYKFPPAFARIKEEKALHPGRGARWRTGPGWSGHNPYRTRMVRPQLVPDQDGPATTPFSTGTLVSRGESGSLKFVMRLSIVCNDFRGWTLDVERWVLNVFSSKPPISRENLREWRSASSRTRKARNPFGGAAGGRVASRAGHADFAGFPGAGFWRS